LLTFAIIDLETSEWARGRGKVPLVEPGQSSPGRFRAGDIDFCQV